MRKLQENNPERGCPPSSVMDQLCSSYCDEYVETLCSFCCAQFCAHSVSKTMSDGSSRARKQIACIGAGIQHNSKSSHSVRMMTAATVNRRVVRADAVVTRSGTPDQIM